MRKLKKLLALLLSFAMIVSILTGIAPARTVTAGNDLEIELTTAGNKGLKVGYKAEEVRVSKLAVGTSSITYDNMKFTFNDGKMDLDPDSKLESGVKYNLTIEFDLSNTTALNGVTSAKIYTYGSSYDKSLSDTVTGTVTVNDGKVTIKTTITAYPTLIPVEEVGKIAWDLYMGNTAGRNAIILDSKNVHFTASQINWYYTSNKGQSRESVSTVTKEANGDTTYYIASMTLTAANGYCFKEYTKDELNSIGSSTVRYNFNYGTSSKNKVTLEITGITPVASFGMTSDRITQIEFDTERVLAYYDGVTTSDLFGILPGSIRVAYGTDGVGYITIDKTPWKIYKADGTLASGKLTNNTTYYACYLFTDLAKEFKKWGKTDYFNLFNCYAMDQTPEFWTLDAKLKTFRQTGWTIKVETSSAGNNMTLNSPEFTFNNDNTYKVTTQAGTIAGTAVTTYPPSNAGIFAMQFGTGNTVSGNSVAAAAIYTAWGKKGTAPATPVVYKYLDVRVNNIISAETLTVTLPTVPATDQEIMKSFINYGNIRGDANIMNAIDLSKIWTVWTSNSGGFIYENGVTKFAELGAYTLNVYVPIKKGYMIMGGNFTLSSTDPAKTGWATTEGNLLHICYYLQKITDKTGFISAKGVKKKMYFKNFEAPISGMTVPKKLELTDPSSKYASFVNIAWTEEGKNFTGSTFTAGKRYEATVVLNAQKGFITVDYANARELVGDSTYVISALADKTKQTIEIRYAFGICPTKTVKKIESISIEMEHGVTVDAFKAKLNEKKTVKVTFSDKSTEYIEVKPGFKSGSTQYTDFYEQFTSQYPGDKGYNPEKDTAQSFTLYGNIDLRSYSGSDRNSVKIDILVKAQDMCTVTFDAYGGVYLGEKTMKVKKNGAYGFSYDPAKIYREGYFFAGWYLKPGDNYDAVDRVWSKSICTSDVTLYAHWLKTFTGIVWEVTATSHSKGSITVKWDNIKTLYNGFEVEISRDGIIWSEPENVGKAKTKYYTGLESGKYYYVRVRAYRYDSAGKIVYGSWNNKLTKVKVK